MLMGDIVSSSPSYWLQMVMLKLQMLIQILYRKTTKHLKSAFQIQLLCSQYRNYQIHENDEAL